MLPKRNESIQSYIFRILVCNGEYDFSSVISYQGGWYLEPEIDGSIRHLFKSTDESQVITIIQESITNAIKINHRANPQFYISYLNKIFTDINYRTPSIYTIHTPQPILKSNQVKISYCEKCIQEDIHSIGHSFFRAHWLHNNNCNKHHSYLNYFSSSSHSESIYKLKKAFKGDFSYRNEVYEGKKTSVDINLQKTDYSPAFKIPLTMCLQSLLVKKMKYFTRLHVEGLLGGATSPKIREMVIYYYKIRYRNGRYKYIDPAIVDQFFEDMLELNFKPINDFFENECEEISIRDNTVTKSSSQKKILAPIDRDCTHCCQMTFMCPLSKIIFLENNNQRSINNFCDDFLSHQ